LIDVCTSFADFLERNGVRLIVNCATELANHFPEKFAYCNVRLNDQEELEDALEAFQRGHIGDTIERVRSKGESVLVHCRAGASRSVTIVIAYLMLYKKMTLKGTFVMRLLQCIVAPKLISPLPDAFLLVKTRRPIAGPNKGYMKQLTELERRTTGVSTFIIRDYYQQVLVEMGFDKDKVAAALDYGLTPFPY